MILLTLIACLLTKATSSDRGLISRLTSVQHQPLEAKEIYRIHTPTAAQCTYACIQNVICVTALYNVTASRCHGYRAKETTDVALPKDVMAWNIEYEECSDWASCLNDGVCIEGQSYNTCNCSYGFSGTFCQTADRVNVLAHPNTSCISSGDRSDTYLCTNAFDGTWTMPGGLEWMASETGPSTWIKVSFAHFAAIDEIQLWGRCAARDKATRILFEMADNIAVEKNGPCDGGDDTDSCADAVGFVEFYPSSVMATDWVKITALEMCPAEIAGKFGLRELICNGRFVTDRKLDKY